MLSYTCASSEHISSISYMNLHPPLIRYSDTFIETCVESFLWERLINNDQVWNIHKNDKQVDTYIAYAANSQRIFQALQKTNLFLPRKFLHHFNRWFPGGTRFVSPHKKRMITSLSKAQEHQQNIDVVLFHCSSSRIFLWHNRSKGEPQKKKELNMLTAFNLFKWMKW